MGLAYRMLVVDQSDRVFRFANAKYEEMFRRPRTHRYPVFAGQRVRAACVVVQLVDRKPVDVVSMALHLLTFDQAGYFDMQTFNREKLSRIDEMMRSERGVVNGGDLLAARGARWTPSDGLARALHDAALDRMKSPRL